MYKVNLFFKRFFDILCSLLAILIIWPVMLVIGIMIKVDSKGPVLYKQERRTKNGKVFVMYKYRTMVVNADKMEEGLFTYQDDVRVTKFGKKLRSTSLDELPQLLNIFKGDMSIVGPRPCVTYELGDFDTLNKRYKKRFEVRAGLTGLAQINSRNDLKWDEKVEFDNQYIDELKRIGILCDINIIIATIKRVVLKKDIYESKSDETITNAEAAKREEAEIIRIAHLPD